MPYSTVFSKLLKGILFIFISGTLVSCGGGGGSGDEGASTTPTGQVSILLTDGFTDVFDKVIITVDSISFIGSGEGNQSNVINEAITKDLLQLQNYSEKIASVSVKAGTYSKIRLHVNSIELIDKSKNVTGCTEAQPCKAKLPSGKIDLNLKEGFTIPEGDHITIQLDMDAKKSFLITQAGNGKTEYIFRPVVFVEFVETVGDSVVALQQGRVLGKTENGFQLCDVQLSTSNDTCILILFSDSTAVQNELIEQIVLDDINNTDIVNVIGRPNGAAIEALHIVKLSENSHLALISGNVTSTIDVGRFTMLTDNDNGMVQPQTSITVSLRNGAGVRIFNKYGNELAADVITSGNDVDVFGLVQTDNSVIAAFVIADNNPAADTMAGKLVAVDAAQLQLTVFTSSIGDSCVDISSAQLYFLDLIGGTVVNDQISIENLRPDMPLEAYGQVDPAGCFVANVILVAPASVSPLKTPLVDNGL